MTTRITHVLVPIDLGGASQRALEMAMDLAAQYGAKLTLLHVCEVPSYAYAGAALSVADLLSPVEEAARAELARALAEAQKRFPSAAAILRKGDPAHEICAAIADEGADLVVMGTHGREGVSHAWFGSVAEKVVRLSPAPVLIARAR